MTIKIILWNIAMSPATAQRNKYKVPKIARILNTYDIVILNESFAFHEALMSNVKHSYRYTDPRIWYKLFNSGVVILSKRPLANCSYKHFGHSALWDWFLSKGLNGMTFKYHGVKVDLYATHLQASNHRCAQKVRVHQIQDIVNQINATHTANHELIVCGDFQYGSIYDAIKYNIKEKETILPLKWENRDGKCAIIYKGKYADRVHCIQTPDIIDEQGIPLSEYEPVCIAIEV